MRLVIVLALCICLTGCVQRRMTIRSNPPGAMVYIDDYEIGTTPVSTDFIYYGTRKFRLVKPGYETLVVEQRIRPPWYQIFPLDFFSENVVPREIRDERTIDFQMIPQRIATKGEILERAEAVRSGSKVEGFIPEGGVPGNVPIPGMETPTRTPRRAPGYLAPGFGAPPDLPPREPVRTGPNPDIPIESLPPITTP